MTAAPHWDARHQAPIVQWADPRLLTPSGDRTHYVLAAAPERGEHNPMNVLYQRGTTDTLLVVLHGAIDREKYTLPRFEWLGTLASREEHVLYVSDPTLALAADLQIGWYVDAPQADGIGRVARVAERVQEALGLRRILFLGGSAGGFASLMASARVASSRALAFNPQITISEYYPRFVARFMEVVLPGFTDFDEARRALPRRLSVLDEIPANERRRGRALIVQNSGDEFHMQNHLGHLANHLGMPPERAVSDDGNMEFDVRYFSDGHTMPYRHVLTRYLDLSLDHWDAARIVGDTDEIPSDESAND